MNLTYSELLEVTAHNRHFVQAYMPREEVIPVRSQEEQDWQDVIRWAGRFWEEDAGRAR